MPQDKTAIIGGGRSSENQSLTRAEIVKFFQRIGGFMGLPPSHKRVEFSAVCLYEFLGRKIARERRIYDFTGVLVQTGVLKANLRHA